MIRILLTGKSGQVGYELERSLQSCGTVVAPTRGQFDLGDLRQVKEIVRTVTPDVIVNAAAYTDVDGAERDPALAMRINRDAPEAMANEARKIGAMMVHYSTDYVFDGAKGLPYLEDDMPDPVNLYGQSKLAGEQAIQASGAAAIILRTSWVYGLRRRNFLRSVTMLADERKALRMVNDRYGSPTWCRIVADVSARLIHRARLEPAHAQERDANRDTSIFHLACTGKASRYEFAQAILKQRFPEKEIDMEPVATKEVPGQARRPANTALCCRKLQGTGIHLPEWRNALSLCLS
jgi:dTDP-4-dehydrorhamnose reductase